MKRRLMLLSGLSGLLVLSGCHHHHGPGWGPRPGDYPPPHGGYPARPPVGGRPHRPPAGHRPPKYHGGRHPHGFRPR